MNKPRGILIIAAGGKKTPFSITASKSGDTAFIKLSGYISQWSTASSGDIEAKIKEYKKDGITKAELYINTQGGDVFEATEINNLLEDSFETVTIRVGALAASAGTYFLTKYYAVAKKNSQFMIHKPMGGASGNEDEVSAGLKAIQNITSDYRAAYADKMSMTEKEVDKLWAKGDYWMTAKQALKLGLIDEIEDADEKIDASAILQLEACGAPHIPEKTTKNDKQKTMDKAKLCATLGLPADSTDAVIEAKLSTLKVDAQKGLEIKAAADVKAKQDQTAKIKARLDKAENVDKVISAAQRASYEKLAQTDFVTVEAILDTATPIQAISAQMQTGKKGVTDKGITAQKDWTYEDYQSKDPKAFEALAEDQQDALIEAFYED